MQHRYPQASCQFRVSRGGGPLSETFTEWVGDASCCFPLASAGVFPLISRGAGHFLLVFLRAAIDGTSALKGTTSRPEDLRGLPVFVLPGEGLSFLFRRVSRGRFKSVFTTRQYDTGGVAGCVQPRRCFC